jgi:hypothetical protein
MDDSRTIELTAIHGRDCGKRFEVREIDPLTLSGYVLRLVSALRVASYEALLEQFTALDKARPPIDVIMRVLQGSDPRAVHELLSELLDFVRIAPDPQHPGAFRDLNATDIREIRTLGDVMSAVVKLHFADA